MFNDNITSSDQLNQYLKNVPNFKGVIHRNQLKNKKISNNESYITNLDNKGSGSHWVAWYNSPKFDHVYYFDPFGITCPEDVKKYLKSGNKAVLMNNGQIQHINSSSCGYYCMKFIMDLSKGTAFYEFLYQFDSYPSNNNEKIINAFKNNL